MKEITTSAATAVPVGSKSKKMEASPEVFSLMMRQLTVQAGKEPASPYRNIRDDGANRRRTRNGYGQQYGTSAAGVRNHFSS